jgi:hypothetical protein
VSDHQISIVSIPARGDGSPTHRAFAPLALQHPETGQTMEAIRDAQGAHAGNLYYFAHGEGRQRACNAAAGHRLMVDPAFRRQSDALGRAWNQNVTDPTVQQYETAGEQDLAGRQLQTMNSRLIAAWRTGRATTPSPGHADGIDHAAQRPA